MSQNTFKKTASSKKPLPSDFCLNGSIRYAWLIRQDVRQDADIDDPEAQKDFILWWALYGEKEYPNAEPLSEELKQCLFELLDEFPQINGFGISRLMKHLYDNRADIQKLYDITTIEGVIDFVHWFYLYGINEHKLNQYLTRQILIDLNKPQLSFENQDLPANLPQLSALMFFTWGIRKDIQTVFDLKSYPGRMGFLGWFFLQGVADLKIQSMISHEWLDWLNDNIELDNHVFLKRTAQLFWYFREDVNKAFDFSTQQGIHDLQNWTSQALQKESATQWIAQRTADEKIKLGVNLIGFAFGELGIGEDVRMAAAALDQVDIPYTVVNIPPGSSVRQEDTILAEAITDQIENLTYQTNIFCLTGFDTAHVYLEKGRQLFENRYNIGWWPWELPVWPENWLQVFDLVDEVWAATQYTQSMYQHSTHKPVTLMPLPVCVDRLSSAQRQNFSLPETGFLFLYIFDFNSYLDRKNPHAAVNAFLTAFPKDLEHDVKLVLKTMNSQPNNPKWMAFKALCEKDDRIILLEKTLDRGDILALINACDTYVSLHRAEGFGRTLAEAMLMGKPVVATDFSGNKDFVNHKTGFPVKWQKKDVNVGEYPFITNKSQAYWAEPDINDAAQQMTAAYLTTNDKNQGNKIKAYARQQFSLSRIGLLMKKRLCKLL